MRFVAQQPLSTETVMQWDTIRRTMEFFDRTLATLRTFGLSSTVAVFIAATQYNAPSILLFSVPLYLILLLLDLHYQRYMWVTSKYAISLEQSSAFFSPGLTAVLNYEHQKRMTRHLFPAAYLVIIIMLMAYWASMLGLWSALCRVLVALNP